MNSIGIIGLGWFGMELALSLKDEYKVIGSKRIVPSEEIQNLEILPFDINDGEWENCLEPLLKVDSILLNIPPSGAKTQDEFVFKSKRIIDRAYESGVKHFLFISSTGVFSNNQHIVDENTTPIPETANGRCLVQIESHLVEKPFPIKHIIRPGGLIGGKRHPIFFLAGKTNVSGRFHPVNLVHRKDLVDLTKKVIELSPSQTYIHAVSPEYPTKEGYYIKAADHFQLTRPKFNEDFSKGKKVLSKLSAECTGFEYYFKSPIEMLSSIERI